MMPSESNKRKHSRRWTKREMRTLLKILEEHGDENIEKIAQFIPTRTKSEIAGYLRKHQRAALEKFRKRKRLQIQHSFEQIHPWMSYINVHCDSNVKSNDPSIIANILPILERYACSSPAQFGKIHFQSAYRALFNALTIKKWPSDLNAETFSMIYASLNSLHVDVRMNMGEDAKFKAILKQCLQRHFADTELRGLSERNEEDTLMLPQVNVLQLTPEELDELCEVSL